jgi:hypothetical protein
MGFQPLLWNLVKNYMVFDNLPASSPTLQTSQKNTRTHPSPNNVRFELTDPDLA